MRPPILHPFPAFLGASALALAVLQATTSVAPNVYAIVDTSVLLLTVGWGGRKLWKVSEDVKALPTRQEFEALKHELRAEISAAMSKVASQANAVIGTVEEHLDERLSNLESRFDRHIDGGTP